MAVSDANRFVQELGMLLLACEPLVSYCLLTEEEHNDLIKSITAQVIRCQSIRDKVEQENIDRQNFGDQLTEMFS